MVRERWVAVEKRKYPGRVRGSWEARAFAEDAHGLWLFAEAGVRNRHDLSGVQLLPADRWWVAWWWDDPEGWWCAADVATPARLVDGTWRYDDLEIDVVGNEGGFVMVVDEDEFEEAQATVPYPADVTAAALAARDELIIAMRDGIEPFGQLPWERLRRCVEGA